MSQEINSGRLGQSAQWTDDGAVLLERVTNETRITLRLSLAAGAFRCDSGIAFLDHMLQQLCFHAGWSLNLECRGDVQVDDHHSTEDIALALGAALRLALDGAPAKAAEPVHSARSASLAPTSPERRRQRFGSAYAPLDEALARVVIDLSGRPFARVRLKTRGERVGALACENAEHFFASFAQALRATLHVSVLYGRNDHHRIEAAFKALALALRQACALAGNLQSGSLLAGDVLIGGPHTDDALAASPLAGDVLTAGEHAVGALAGATALSGPASTKGVL